MRYFIIILLLLNIIALHNVLGRKYDHDDDDDDEPVGRQRNVRAKKSEDNRLQSRQRSEVTAKNTRSFKTDLDTDKPRGNRRKYDDDDDEKVSNRRVYNPREDKRQDGRKPSPRGETNKYSRQEERRSPKVADSKRRAPVKILQTRQSNVRGRGKASAKVLDDTDEDDDDTDEDDDDDDTDEDDDDDDVDDDDDDDTDEDDDDDDDTDEDDDDTDEDDDDDDDDDTDEDDDETDEDDDSFEMISYSDKKKPTFLQRLKGKKNEKPKKELSYRKKVYRELGLVEEDIKNISSEEVAPRKKYTKKNKRNEACDSMEEDCP